MADPEFDPEFAHIYQLFIKLLTNYFFNEMFCKQFIHYGDHVHQISLNNSFIYFLK